MLQRNLSESQGTQTGVQEDLNAGIPTISALASLCSQSWAAFVDPEKPTNELPAEAKAILCVARKTGSISIRCNKNAFEPGQRYLAICVEQDDGSRTEFRVPGNPEQTIRFLDGFRHLARAGMVMHQLMNEFSLTAAGFHAARQIDDDSVSDLIEMGQESV